MPTPEDEDNFTSITAMKNRDSSGTTRWDCLVIGEQGRAFFSGRPGESLECVVDCAVAQLRRNAMAVA